MATTISAIGTWGRKKSARNIFMEEMELNKALKGWVEFYWQKGERG